MKVSVAMPTLDRLSSHAFKIRYIAVHKILTLEYLINVQFDVVEVMANDQFKTLSIDLNAQHVNGMTPFDLAVICTIIRYSRVRYFDSLAQFKL